MRKHKDELKPKFKSTPTQFQTIIFASSDTPNVGDHDGDVSETKLTDRQQKILNLIKESPTITGKQMSEILSVSQRTIERDLAALQKIGVLKREGKDNELSFNFGLGATVPFYCRLRESGYNKTYMRMYDHVKPFLKLQMKYSIK